MVMERLKGMTISEFLLQNTYQLSENEVIGLVK